VFIIAFLGLTPVEPAIGLAANLKLASPLWMAM
jgi:hypothetical protein